MPPTDDQQRSTRLYFGLRERLLDLSSRNRMLNYPVGSRSRRQVVIVDEIMEDVHRLLVSDGVTLDLEPLPRPQDAPDDEETADFRIALEHARVGDAVHIAESLAIEAAGRDDDAALAVLDRALRDRVRVELGLPQRDRRVETDRMAQARRLGIEPNPDLPAAGYKPSHTDRNLQTLKYPDELDATLDRICADASLAEQETGQSDLYLAFGFLQRFESDSSERKLLAPLVLLPVRIEARTTDSGRTWSILAIGAAEINASLARLMERDFGLSLPDFETDEDGTGSIEAYLEQVRIAIELLRRWQVRRTMVLGHFPVGRLAMYADLDPTAWSHPPAGRRLVDAVLAGTDEGRWDAEASILPDHPIDDPDADTVVPYLIHDADASQHNVLVDATRGRDLVVQGAPGTGKSQTIANIVANALGSGKTVLVLAEKQGALETVRRRLDAAGLGDFCLSLHSERASPQRVVDALRRRAELGWGRAPRAQPILRDATMDESRRELDRYVEALHQEGDDGRTPYELIWNAIAGQNRHADVIQALRRVSLPKSLLDSGMRILEAVGKLEVYAAAAESFARDYGHPALSPWSQTVLADISAADIGRLKDLLGEMLAATGALCDIAEEAVAFGARSIADLQSIVTADRMLGVPPDTLSQPERFVDLDHDDVFRIAGLREKLKQVDAELAARPKVAGIPLEVLARASAMVTAGLDGRLLDLNPDAARVEADRCIADGRRLAGAIDRMLPAVDMIGLDRQSTLAEIDTLAQAIQFLSRAEPGRRSLLDRFALIEEREFLSVRQRWLDAVDAETDWRTAFVAYGDEPWPTIAEIEACEATLTRSGFARRFGLRGGSEKTARALLARLAGPDGVVPDAEELAQFIIYLRYLAAFENDPQLAALFGPAWAGLGTPMEDCAIIRRDFRAALAERPGSARIATLVVGAGPGVISRLADMAAAAQAFRSLPESLLKRYGTGGLGTILSAIEAERDSFSALIDLDPDRELSGIPVPIRDIADMHTRLERRASIVEAIGPSQLAQDWDHLFPDGTGMAEVARASEWVKTVGHLRSVRSSTGRLDLECLSGPDAPAMRRRLADLAARLDPPLGRFAQLKATIEAEFGQLGLNLSEPNAVLARVDTLLGRKAELNSYLALGRLRRELAEAGAGEFLETCDRARVAPERLPILFETLVAQRRADNARRGSPALWQVTGVSLEARRRTFADRDRRRMQSDREAIVARLLQATPPVGSISGMRTGWTEMALLRNEFGKQRRHLPVRTLLRRAGQAAQTLMPCLLASPLSLARYLEPDRLSFDLLVIDEASQMPVENALGALARARQVVVFGDTRQLPPMEPAISDAQAFEDEADDRFDDDTVSVLDACRHGIGQVRRLKWHYRSRAESLFAFPNREFYQDSLTTVPEARTDAFAVDLVRVDGACHYRRNVSEAARIAEEAIGFMRRFAASGSETMPTLGIVAATAEQRDLILAELRRLEAGDGAVEVYRMKAANLGEPVFVKTIDSVQGDERDVVLISLTFGRDRGGVGLGQRLGPFEGRFGAHRLNVLVTRARRRIGLFASFGADDVAVTDTSAPGLLVLRRFLDHVETRGRVLAAAAALAPDGDFEREIGRRLSDRGYQVATRIGLSHRRVELAIRHPDRPDRFLCGLQGDGADYALIASARDRDRIGDEVLRLRGWDLIRLWSTDWLEDAEEETERLVRRLEQIRTMASPADIEIAFGRRLADLDREAPPAAPFDEATIRLVTMSGDPGPSGLFGFNEGGRGGGPDMRSDRELARALVDFREHVIARRMPRFDRERSILRDTMIEFLIDSRLDDPNDWDRSVPGYLRAGTNPAERRMFLPEICGILDRRVRGQGLRLAASRGLPVVPRDEPALSANEDRSGA